MKNRNEKNYLITWVGGKRNLRKRIAEIIPEDIESYIEPFGGGGWVLFYKDKWANLEIYNDLDSRLTNLFRCVKYHKDELKKELKYMFASRSQFFEALKNNAVTDIQNAARFMFLITRSFGGKGKTFGTSVKGATSMKSTQNIIERIDDISQRLDKVLIENLDFKDIFRIYDYEKAFFYCDPPYSQGEGYITTSTKDFDHIGLAETLKNIKGRFLLSYDNSDFIKELYKDFYIQEIERPNGINRKNILNSRYKELLITNYEPRI